MKSKQDTEMPETNTKDMDTTEPEKQMDVDEQDVPKDELETGKIPEPKGMKKTTKKIKKKKKVAPQIKQTTEVEQNQEKKPESKVQSKKLNLERQGSNIEP